MARAASRVGRISAKSWRNLLALLAPFAAGLLLVVGADAREAVTPERIQAEILALGGLGLAGYLLAATIRPLFVVISGSLFSVAAGMVWGPWWGTGLALCGALLSSALVFALARGFGAGAVRDLAGDRFPRFARMAQARGFAFVFLATLGFAFPTDLVIAVAACSGVRGRTVLLATCLGTLPGTAAMVAMGATVIRPTPVTWWLGGGAVLGLTLLALLLARVWFPRIRTDRPATATRELVKRTLA